MLTTVLKKKFGCRSTRCYPIGVRPTSTVNRRISSGSVIRRTTGPTFPGERGHGQRREDATGSTVVPVNMDGKTRFPKLFQTIKGFLNPGCLMVFDNGAYSDTNRKLVEIRLPGPCRMVPWRGIGSNMALRRKQRGKASTLALLGLPFDYDDRPTREGHDMAVALWSRIP